MPSLILSQRDALNALCQKWRVSRLALFGSAVRGGFDASASDLDFLVEFEAMPPIEYADSYFGLAGDLDRLFGIPIDLVERAPIRNPIFLKAVTTHQIVLYDAA